MDTSASTGFSRPMVLVRNVSVRFPSGVVGLCNVNLSVEKGEFVSIVGGSGTGKSTLLKLIYREIVPTEGTVFVDGRDVSRLKRHQVSMLRRGIGVIFQDFKLLPERKLWENVAFALRVTGVSGKEIRRRVPPVLELVGLLDRGDAYPHELSGGEQQRACIARSMAHNPKILIADEPTGNLDPDTSWEIIGLLGRINLRGTTVVMASHDAPVVDRLKRRVVALEGGRVVRDQLKGTYHGLVRKSPIPKNRVLTSHLDD